MATASRRKTSTSKPEALRTQCHRPPRPPEQRVCPTPQWMVLSRNTVTFLFALRVPYAAHPLGPLPQVPLCHQWRRHLGQPLRRAGLSHTRGHMSKSSRQWPESAFKSRVFANILKTQRSHRKFKMSVLLKNFRGSDTWPFSTRCLFWTKRVPSFPLTPARQTGDRKGKTLCPLALFHWRLSDSGSFRGQTSENTDLLPCPRAVRHGGDTLTTRDNHAVTPSPGQSQSPPWLLTAQRWA